MSTVKFDTWQNTDGTENYKCRAWVNFNGTETVAIRAGGNVSSITDNGTGQYTVNFTTSMVDTNYAVGTTGNGSVDTFGSAGRQWYMLRIRATNYVQVNAVDDGGSNSDASFISVSIFR